jgi:hypothetical protein
MSASRPFRHTASARIHQQAHYLGLLLSIDKADSQDFDEYLINEKDVTVTLAFSS